MPESNQYHRQVRAVLKANGEVCHRDVIRKETAVPDWYLREMTSEGAPFYSSLNQNRQYVASKHLVGRRADSVWFWRPEVDDGVAVFHREGTAKATVKKLAQQRPSGLTAGEANELLGRDCYRILDQLSENNLIRAVSLGDTTVYVHPWESERANQVAERKTDERIELGSPDDPVDEYLFREELLAVFMAVAAASITSAPIERVAACVLRQFEGDSFAAVETRLRRNHSLRDALGYVSPDDVDDATTLWRTFDALTSEELKACLGSLISEILADADDEEPAGRFILVDGTHVEAWANTRDEIDDGAVEGAAWGKHEGFFYGYRVMLVVDPAIELPVGILVRPGNESEQALFAPLIEDFAGRYDTDEYDCKAVFVDAGFDNDDNLEECEAILEAPLNTGINPRRSKPLKALKQEIKEVFEKHGGAIETPYDALKLLPQTLLSDYGVDLGSVEETYLFRAIKERMNRHLRSAAERVIGRMKEFTGLAGVRARKESSARTHILLSAVALATVAVTAKRVGKPSLMRSPSRII